MGSMKDAAVDRLIPHAFERVEVACRSPGADVEVAWGVGLIALFVALRYS
jgi:hypothetical protein